MSSKRAGGRRRRTLNSWPVWLFLVYLALAALNRFTPSYTECLTDSWCLSSRRDWWLLSLVQMGFLIFLAFAARFALVWALRMLASPLRHWWFLLFFAVLGILGLVAWIATVPRTQWGDTAHVPAVGALMIALGVAMYFGLRPRPPRRPHRK